MGNDNLGTKQRGIARSDKFVGRHIPVSQDAKGSRDKHEKMGDLLHFENVDPRHTNDTRSIERNDDVGQAGRPVRDGHPVKARPSHGRGHVVNGGPQVDRSQDTAGGAFRGMLGRPSGRRKKPPPLTTMSFQNCWLIRGCKMGFSHT